MIRVMWLFNILVCTLLCGCKVHPQTYICDTVYNVVDEIPRYKDNASDLIREVQSTLHFDSKCKPEDLRQISWVIDSQGKIVNVEILGLIGGCKESVETQVKQFTDWTPGRQKGKPVCVRVVLPVHIRPSR